MLQKDQYYWIELRRALQEGQWLNQYPARTPDGTALSWSELFRKFNKHCRGFNDIAEIASQTHALAVLLTTDFNEDQDDPSSTVYPLDLADDGVLPEERREEAGVGYGILKKLQSSHMDTLSFALAYYAYAMGNPAGCLSHLSEVPDLLHLQNHIPSESVPSTTSSASTLHTSFFGTRSSLTSTGGAPLSVADSLAPEVKNGRAWALTETIRSLCLQGMSNEKLTPSTPMMALKSYAVALPFLSTFTSEMVSNVPSSGSGRIHHEVFMQYHELWCWVERLLWRAIVLSSRICDIREGEGSFTSVWTWFGRYSTCTIYWPPNFRTQHRSTTSVLYLRAFIMRYGAEPSPLKRVAERSQKPPAWLTKARSVVNDYRAVLNISTNFPRAGKRNTKVEDFVDLCVGVWEASGAVGDSTGWVIDVLWWATRLTSNSYRVLRHMTRLFYVSGDASLARRTLHLYMQVVEKIRQAAGETEGEESDSNEHWVETLVSGARALCKVASILPGTDGINELKEAKTSIEKARTRLDNQNERLVASADLAEGVWSSVMALKEQDPDTRPKRLEDAHASFLRSVAVHPTPAAYFHLALSFTRPGPNRNISRAIECAGLAVEGDAQEIRYWHLLGLLLAVEEQWKAAAEILERGAELEDEQVYEDGETGTAEVGEGLASVTGSGPEEESKANGTIASQHADTQSNGHGSLNNDSIPRSTLLELEPKRVSLIPLDATELPNASRLLQPRRDHLPSSRLDWFEQALQLRMTQGVLTEVVEGPEGAEVKWLEIFSWVAEKRGQGEGTPHGSIDGSRPSEKDLSFMNAAVLLSLPENPPLTEDASEIEIEPAENGLETPIPIAVIPITTVSPATPDTDAFPHQRDSIEKKRTKRSTSIERDTTKFNKPKKKVQQMLKHRVHQGQVRITSISRRIGSGVRNGGGLKRTLSAPDFHALLRQTSYQASSIHSRRRVSSIRGSQYSQQDEDLDTPPPAPSPVPPLPPLQDERERKKNKGLARTNRLIADLWLMSAATFRRLGKIEQAKGSIQEAEVQDEGNPGVWVQLGLYYMALNKRPSAISAFQKALLIDPADVAASVHLARAYIEGEGDSLNGVGAWKVEVDLAAGILSHLTRGNGWDVPEAWYFLAKAYEMQGRKERERESLEIALELSEKRGIREIGYAVGWCL